MGILKLGSLVSEGDELPDEGVEPLGVEGALVEGVELPPLGTELLGNEICDAEPPEGELGLEGVLLPEGDELPDEGDEPPTDEAPLGDEFPLGVDGPLGREGNAELPPLGSVEMPPPLPPLV